ncbi:MAG: M23 family metallopeptidase [Mucilaginibacter sp.]
MRFFCFLLAALCLITADASCQTPSYQTSVNMEVPFVPPVTTINGRPFLYYELHLTNYAKDTIELTALTVLNTSDAAALNKLDRAGLASHFVRLGQAKNDTVSILAPGASGVVFIEMALPGLESKWALIHHIDLNILKNNRKIKVTTKGALVGVPATKAIVIGPPLSGGPWAAIYDPLWAIGHRRVFYTVGGTARLPGRFAIDFIKLDNSGKYGAGSTDSISHWYGYAADVLAVADGVVSSVRTDAAESPTLSGYIPALPENATGNYISINIGAGQYAFYEHLKPGSIRVRPGQKVKKGQVIASLGFTGQTTGPHLHLHIANADVPLGAEGISFEFEHYTLLGNYRDFETFGVKPWISVNDGKSTKVTREHPGPQAVIDFSAE